MQGFIILAFIFTEKDTLVFYSTLRFCQYHWSMKCRSRVPGHGVLEEYIKENSYARFLDQSYHRYR